MILKNEVIKDILCCPHCRNSISFEDEKIVCKQCGHYFFIEDGVPVFIENKKTNQITTINENEEKKNFKLIYKKISSTLPSHTMWIDDTIFNFINNLSTENKILNLGSGTGLFDDKIRVPMINLDVYHNDRVHVIADGHYLPFKDGSFDCVFSNAVLEHVKRPWEVAKEMERVVKVGGYIVVNLPFLNTIHHEEDYFRFTLKGIEELFLNCERLYGGVSSGGGSFLPLCIVQYISLFIPTKFIRMLAYFMWAQIFFRLKVIDRLICSKKDYMITANSFYFIGRRIV